MKIKQIILAGFIAISTYGFCQTKLIAHKSHSGSAKNFKTVIENNLFNSDCSNFGVGPDRTVSESQLDSVVFVSDSSAIMYTSRFCSSNYSRSNFKKWSPGSEVVYNHPLFSKQHSLDEIKEALKNYYYFRNSIEKVKFIGYDNKSKKYKNEKKDTIKETEPVFKQQPASNSDQRAVESPHNKKQKRMHSPNKMWISNDMIWLLEIVSLISMATGVTLIKLR